MNNYILNILPYDIIINKRIETNNYTFLNFMEDKGMIKYYELLNSVQNFKLKNVYQFLFLRSIKLNRSFSEIPVMKKETIQDNLNEILNNYINNDPIIAIIIMNGIQQYFSPVK
tara:strand:+ start:7597 stop:7938 length:342 start_codon:yes stop_codon:yes gene_type:complete